METLELLELFRRGGVFMWPLVACSVVAVAAILERSVFYASRPLNVPRTLETLRRRFAGESAPRTEKGPLVRLGEIYLSNRGAAAEHRRNVMARFAASEVKAHERYLRLLAVIAAVSPLIGLLGTVWGMVLAFFQIEALGENVRPGDFAGGIWAALLTTVFGLVVAIPSTVAARLFEARVERLAHDMNEVASFMDEWEGEASGAGPADQDKEIA